jgi:hypothetical protein
MDAPRDRALRRRQRPLHEPWRDDRLGRDLAAALEPLSTAQPSERAWERLAARLAADAPVRDRLPRPIVRLVTRLGGRRLLDLPAREVRVRATGLLGAAAMAAISLASVGVLRDAEGGGAIRFAHAAAPVPGLGAYEVAIQPALNPRPVARALPRSAAGSAALQRALQSMRAVRAQRLLEQTANPEARPRHCLEAFPDAYGRRYDAEACRVAPEAPRPGWIRLSDPPQSL